MRPAKVPEPEPGLGTRFLPEIHLNLTSPMCRALSTQYQVKPGCQVYMMVNLEQVVPITPPVRLAPICSRPARTWRELSLSLSQKKEKMTNNLWIRQETPPISLTYSLLSARKKENNKHRSKEPNTSKNQTTPKTG